MKKILWMILFIFAPLASYGEGPNLLKNGDLSTGSEKHVPGWEFSPVSSGIDEETKVAIRDGKVIWGLVEDGAGRALRIAIPEVGAGHVHVWWLQVVPVTGGTTYTLTLRSKGTSVAKKRTALDIGLCTFEDSGKWIGYASVPRVEFTEEWQKYTFTFTSPDNAAKVGVRLGGDSRDGELDILFSNIVLVEQGK